MFEIAKTGGSYASTPTTLVSFDNSTNGGNPEYGALIADAAGNLFGTTADGGATGRGDGTVFELTGTGFQVACTPTLTTLVSFNGANGSSPQAPLIADAAGDLFGMTYFGGANDDGTIFEITFSGGSYASTPTTLVSFNGTNGYEPTGGLIADAAGDLFGTTRFGGAYDQGTVFEIAYTGGTPTTLVSFNGANGQIPEAPLIADAAGDLFGTTTGGGANNLGTVFEIVKTSGTYASTPTTLVSFNGSDGQGHVAGLIADGAGNLFGTTEFGGANNVGTVFELVNNGGSYNLTTLVTFNITNGAVPFGGLIADAAGDLFGTTDGGGANSHGTVFELVNGGGGSYSLTTLISFNGANGSSPQAPLIADAAGDLFGTTQQGGANNDGTVFELVNSGGGSYTTTTLVSVDVNNGRGPQAALFADAAGDLFGTTSLGGSIGDGTVFEITCTGFQVAVSPVFSGSTATSAAEEGGLVTLGATVAPLNVAIGVTITGLAHDLSAFNGGIYTAGTGNWTGTAAQFNALTFHAGEDGSQTLSITATTTGPEAGTAIESYALTVDPVAENPVFGGLTATSAAEANPVISGSTATSAALTTLVNFNGSNGAFPYAGVIADAAGDLFGTTQDGGANGIGTVFEIAKTGGGYASTPTTLVSFGGLNGAYPYGGLIADAAGDLFGTTLGGGPQWVAGILGGNGGNGTVFEIAKTAGGYAGTPTTLVSFNGSNGQNPQAVGLIADAAGDLFGTTLTGGANGPGTVFEIAYTGGGYASTPTTLVSFNGSNGAWPVAGLIADAAGDLLGTTSTGGANGIGTVFEITYTGGSYASTPTILVNFSGTDGAKPFGVLVADAAGDLFGTTYQGGPQWVGGILGGSNPVYGTVFEIVKTAGGYASTPTTLVSFNGSNGANPQAGLIIDAAGNLFGTTTGTVFEIAYTGGVYASTPTTLASFNGANGAYSTAGLTADAAGNLFGTTQAGGAGGAGTVFELTGTGFQVLGGEGGLVTLGATVAPHNGDDGAISVTITGLAHDLSTFNGGLYTAGTGNWTGTATQFNALTFHAGEDGSQTLSITATTTGPEAGTASETYALTVDPAGTGFTNPLPWIHHGGGFVAGEAQYADFNGDGKADLIMQGLDDNFWVSLSTGTGFTNPNSWIHHDGSFVAGEAQYADFNGDGKADLIMQGLDDTFWVSLSTGAGFTNPLPWIHHGGSFVAGEAQYADFNGDGKADLIMQGLDNNFWVSLSTGAGFTNPTSWIHHGGGFVAGEAQYADFNGDGKADMSMQGLDDAFWVSLSTGTGFTDPTPWIHHGGTFQAGEAQYADLNGDGKADLIMQGLDDTFWVSLSTGTGFTNPNSWIHHGGTFQAGEAQYADLNGDHKADLIMQGLDNTFWASLSTGTGFTNPMPWIHHGGGFVAGEAQYADLNGGGKTDLIMQGLDNTSWASLSTGTPPAAASPAPAAPAAAGPGATSTVVQTGPVANGASDSNVTAVPSGALILTAQPTPETFDFGGWVFGNAEIAGFDPTEDAIRLSSGLVGSFASVETDMIAAGAATLITFDPSHSLTLDGVAPASLGAANFRVT